VRTDAVVNGNAVSSVRCDVIITRICYRKISVRPSLRLSVTRVDHSKTVEARVVQFSPYISSPILLVVLPLGEIKTWPRLSKKSEGLKPGVGRPTDERMRNVRKG